MWALSSALFHSITTRRRKLSDHIIMERYERKQIQTCVGHVPWGLEHGNQTGYWPLLKKLLSSVFRVLVSFMLPLVDPSHVSRPKLATRLPVWIVER